MTPNEFRAIALSFPEAAESSHGGHPDFRVGGKVFASLGWPDGEWGMVKLTPEQQDVFVQVDPKAFRPVKGSWGLQGNTNVRLKAVKKSALREAMEAAWKNRAPKKLVKAFEG